MISGTRMTLLGIFAASILGTTPASAHSYRTVERTANLVKSVATITNDDTIVISATLTIRGNGAEENPTTTVEISIDGNACETRTFNWHNGPARFDFSCTIALKKGTHGITVRELSNERATATAISVNMKRAANAESSTVTF